MADEKKTDGAEEKKSGGVVAKVIATVFGAVVAPVAVAVGIKYLSPSDHHPTTPATQPDRVAQKEEERPQRPGGGRKRPQVSKEDPLPVTGRPPLQFNGKDLSGFYPYLYNNPDNDPKTVYSVQDGVLRCSGEHPGYLATQNTFDNYNLVLEYRWGESSRADRVRRFTVMVHANGTDGPPGGGDNAANNKVTMYGYGIRLNEGAAGDLVLGPGGPRPLTLTAHVDPRQLALAPPRYVFQPSNSGGTPTKVSAVNDIVKAAAAEKPPGEWNELKISCGTRDLSIRVFLNGTKVNVGNDPQPNRGKILFITGKSELFIRKIDVLSLK